MIRFECVSKSFDARPVLDRISLTVNRGEVVGLVGASGAGKTTLLRLAAGLTHADAGRVTLDSARLSYVFQEPRLLPWRTAADNIAAAMYAAGIPTSEAREAALEWLYKVGLGGFEGYYPAQLSGGMQQRVALARAFSIHPDILLLDEPFSSLDDSTRRELLGILRQLIRETGCTVLYVTHTLPELLSFATRILRLKPPAVLEEVDLDNRQSLLAEALRAFELPPEPA
jgi:NitT/TauT family transport system ATP-binding protein